jgi:hypothetical protein
VGSSVPGFSNFLASSPDYPALGGGGGVMQGLHSLAKTANEYAPLIGSGHAMLIPNAPDQAQQPYSLGNMPVLPLMPPADVNDQHLAFLRAFGIQ